MLSTSSSSRSLTCSSIWLLSFLLCWLVKCSHSQLNLFFAVPQQLRLRPEALTKMLLRQCHQSIIPYPNHPLGITTHAMVNALAAFSLQKAEDQAHATLHVKGITSAEYTYNVSCEPSSFTLDVTGLSKYLTSTNRALERLRHCEDIAPIVGYLLSNRTHSYLTNPWMSVVLKSHRPAVVFCYYVCCFLFVLQIKHIFAFVTYKLRSSCTSTPQS
uniref:GP2b protein n=1 Tax=Simian hemorrhagic fever virus TaxID=38143 RepID=A0A077ENY2_SHFV|nr:GP2b protein [Simian hemorrhagic fever virus]AIL48162.1 GP2b protein [Simian hemorrhagic fever virus]